MKTTNEESKSKSKSKEQEARLPFFLLLLILLLLLIFPCGCSSTNITKLVGALAKDPAIVSVNVPTMYGTVKFTRVGNATNYVEVTSDGTVKVGKP